MSKVEFPNQAVNIQVVVRCRPPTPKERLGLPMAVTVRGKHEVCVNMKCGQNSINKLFKFDQVYDHTQGSPAEVGWGFLGRLWGCRRGTRQPFKVQRVQ